MIPGILTITPGGRARALITTVGLLRRIARTGITDDYGVMSNVSTGSGGMVIRIGAEVVAPSAGSFAE